LQILTSLFAMATAAPAITSIDWNIALRPYAYKKPANEQEEWADSLAKEASTADPSGRASIKHGLVEQAPEMLGYYTLALGRHDKQVKRMQIRRSARDMALAILQATATEDVNVVTLRSMAASERTKGVYQRMRVKYPAQFQVILPYLPTFLQTTLKNTRVPKASSQREVSPRSSSPDLSPLCIPEPSDLACAWTLVALGQGNWSDNMASLGQLPAETLASEETTGFHQVTMEFTDSLLD
jgi:hypothetical protein